MKTPWTFSRCEVIKVTDGDSVQLHIDTGFNHAATIKVRLLGVDCPERTNPEGWRIAREFAIRWLVETYPVTLECYGPDKYGGRWLGIIRNNMGESLSDALINSGFGVVYNGGKKP